MDYFEGIKQIRSDRQEHSRSFERSRSPMKQAVSHCIRKVHDQQHCSIADSILTAGTPVQHRSFGQKQLRSKQHDEFAVLNYYAKVSKYDLDRSNINMRQAKREKQNRREINARAKRDMI